MDRQFSDANAANKELRLQINSLHEQNSEWGTRLKHYEQIESDLRDALLSAQRIANQVKKEAEKNVEELLSSARIERENILQETARLAELRTAELEATLEERRLEIAESEEQIRQLTKRRLELQALVERSFRHLESIQTLLDDFSEPAKQPEDPGQILSA